MIWIAAQICLVSQAVMQPERAFKLSFCVVIGYLETDV